MRLAYYVAENEDGEDQAGGLQGHMLGCEAPRSRNRCPDPDDARSQYFEHSSEPMTGILNVLENEFDHTQLAGDIPR